MATIVSGSATSRTWGSGLAARSNGGGIMSVRDIVGEFVEFEPGRFRWNGPITLDAGCVRTVGSYRFLDGRVGDGPFMPTGAQVLFDRSVSKLDSVMEIDRAA